MSVTKAIIIFLCAAVAAWFAAYAPGIWHRHKVLDALDAPIARWVCVINGDAVSSQYEGYTTKKYIMLGDQRFYSDEFKRWGRAADYMLVVIDDKLFMNWMRLDFDETRQFAREYGITRAGCRRMAPGDHATNYVVPVTPPINNRLYPGPNVTTTAPSSSTFDWKKAVGPALGPAGNSGTSAPSSTGTSAPAPSSGGVGIP